MHGFPETVARRSAPSPCHFRNFYQNGFTFYLSQLLPWTCIFESWSTKAGSSAFVSNKVCCADQPLLLWCSVAGLLQFYKLALVSASILQMMPTRPIFIPHCRGNYIHHRKWSDRSLALSIRDILTSGNALLGILWTESQNRCAALKCFHFRDKKETICGRCSSATHGNANRLFF